MSAADAAILKVAIDAPLRRSFDYLAPVDVPSSCLQVGTRVRVPFGRGVRVGVLVAVARHSELPTERLKPVLAILDDTPLLGGDMLRLLEWAAQYYQHPLGEVICGGLPVLLRKGRPALIDSECLYRLQDAAALPKGARRRALYELLRSQGGAMTATALEQHAPGWRRTMRALEAGGIVHMAPCDPVGAVPSGPPPPVLNAAQQAAVDAVLQSADRYDSFLLNGVTGSGKTEVYLRVVGATLQAGHQALVLIPEISLSEQTVSRFRQRFAERVVVFHSGLTERERAQAWLLARSGRAAIVIGTRSAVWTPLPRPGVIIVDEEHDLSYKQQEGFRYSARDVAVVRARRDNIPVLLGTATPSLETRFNVERRRYRELRLPERPGAATQPALGVIDLRTRTLHGGLSEPLLAAIDACLTRGEQVLVFMNRRGYAPVMLCHQCGAVLQCRRCDARMAWHRESGRLLCHHCGSERSMESACPDCNATQWVALGHGTERVVEVLTARFPQASIVRIDSDSTRRKGTLDLALNQVRNGMAQILVGTQMLSKGHHFPGVTLAAIVDADSRLYSIDFRASERLAQLIVQVAGRAGRGDLPGRVLIQTHHPDHPLIRTLIAGGYEAVCEQLLEERRCAGLPPYTHLALVRAEAVSAPAPIRFLQRVKAIAGDCGQNIEIFGPMPAPMPRRAGRHRAQLLLQARQRQTLHAFLRAWVPEFEGQPASRGVRWSVDVDPLELY